MHFSIVGLRNPVGTDLCARTGLTVGERHEIRNDEYTWFYTHWKPRLTFGPNLVSRKKSTSLTLGTHRSVGMSMVDVSTNGENH
jgi:hypothetical protein